MMILIMVMTQRLNYIAFSSSGHFLNKISHAMKPKNLKLPIKISEYIQKHFRDDFLFEVKEVKKIKDQLNYFVEVTKDDYVHSLRFNDRGDLVNGTAEEAFPNDIHEERAPGDVPE